MNTSNTDNTTPMAIDEANSPQEVRRQATIRLLTMKIDQFEEEICETTRVICEGLSNANLNLTDEERAELKQNVQVWTGARESLNYQKRSAHESVSQLRVKDVERENAAEQARRKQEQALVEERRMQERLEKQVLNDSRRFVKLKPSKLNFRDRAIHHWLFGICGDPLDHHYWTQSPCEKTTSALCQGWTETRSIPQEDC